MEVDRHIDVLGKSCPIPLIMLAKEVKTLNYGQVVRIVGNDPIFEPSVIDFCDEGEHEIIEVAREGKKATITFRVGRGGVNG